MAPVNVYQPKICISAHPANKSGTMGEPVKVATGALNALVLSHKQQTKYIEHLEEEIRRLNERPARAVLRLMPRSRRYGPYKNQAEFDD